MILVTVAGIKRSASTAQYNMIRLILESKYKEVEVYGQNYLLEGNVVIVKTHEYNSILASKSQYIFTTDRPDEEIEESLLKFGRHNRLSIGVMRNGLDLWKRRSYNQDFKDIVENPKECIKQIANKLHIVIDIEDIYSKFKAIKPEKEYNPITMLFPNHISK